jgi:multicomponent Na+:H+ antiporter subunit F
MIGETRALLDWAVLISTGLVSVALVLTFIRLVRGPSLTDRVVALELTATLTVGMIAIYDVATEQPVFLDVAVVVALIGFLGAVAFARYVEKQAAPEVRARR